MIKWVVLLLLAGCATTRPAREGKGIPETQAPTGPRQEAAAALTEEGRLALAEGQLDKALDHLQEAVALEPHNGPAYFYLAKVQWLKGETELARQLLDRAEVLLQGPEWVEPIEVLKRDLFQIE